MSWWLVLLFAVIVVAIGVAKILLLKRALQGRIDRAGLKADRDEEE